MSAPDAALRILHVLDHSIPLHSGYTLRTRNILLQQRMLGWHTAHITGPKQGSGDLKTETVDGLEFFRTPARAGILARLPVINQLAAIDALAARLLVVARLVRPDILHAHSPALNAIAALRVGRRLRIPVVYEVRAFWEDAAVDHGSCREGDLRYRASRALETYALRRVDAVTTICEGLRAEIAARGIAAAKLTVIPNAVDSAGFQTGAARDDALAAQLGLAGKRVLGFIGSFYAYEGLHILLNALPEILSRQPDVRLLLVGGGEQEAELQQLARQLKVDQFVTFYGRVPHHQVQRFYRLIDLLVYPRVKMRLTDLVTPLKPLEAMAQGRLLIASDVGGHRELIVDGATGLLFAPGDPQALAGRVLEVLSAPQRWHALTAGARRFIEEQRSWPASVARYRAVYHGVAPNEYSQQSAVHLALVGPLPPPAGGMANQTLQLSALLLRDGHRVQLVATNAAYRPAWSGRIPMLRAAVRLLPYLCKLWRAAGQVQLMHVMANSGWSWHLFATPAIWVAYLRNCPVVVNYRGGEADIFLQRSVKWVYPSLSRCAALLVPSGYLQSVFSRHGIASTVMPNVINLQRFSAAPGHAARRELPLSMLTARHLEPMYDNATALRAFALVHRRYPAARLVVAGSGPEQGRLAALVAQLDLTSAVRFAGQVDHLAMAALYREADILLNPSLVDNMPNSILEALASGVAVVSSNVGGVPFLVQHRHSALLVPAGDPQAMADAALQLVADASLRLRLRHAGLQLARQYTWDLVGPRLLKVYRSVIDAPLRAGRNA